MWNFHACRKALSCIEIFETFSLGIFLYLALHIFLSSLQKDGVIYYNYGGWWSVWWMGTYSMVLSKAAFFHKKYLDLYTYNMPSSIHDYVTRERLVYNVKLCFRNIAAHLLFPRVFETLL